MLKNGYLQIYTGNGKGKTTAALGLAFRASGEGLKTIIIQFMKKGNYSEINASEKMNGMIIFEQFGCGEFYNPATSQYIEHRKCAKDGLLRARQVVTGGEFDIVILDEIFGALEYNLVTYEELIDLIELRNKQVELVLTGRNAPSDLYARCDLVTEMTEIKHYYNEGVSARRGIES